MDSLTTSASLVILDDNDDNKKSKTSATLRQAAINLCKLGEALAGQTLFEMAQQLERMEIRDGNHKN